MFSAAVRVLARAATIQLEEAAAAHPRAPARTLLKGKERALPIRRDIRPEPAVVESDLGVHAGTEGFGVEENELAQKGTTGLGPGHGMEEHLASIVDEIPQNQKNETSAGPSRITRLPPQTILKIPQVNHARRAQPVVEPPTPLTHHQLDVDAAKSVPTPQPPTPPKPKPDTATPSPVEDSPLIQAELPVTDQLHEILESKTDKPHSVAKPAEQPLPAATEPVDEPVVSPPPQPTAKLSADPLPSRTEEMESGDIPPTNNESPLPVADDTEDVSPLTHFCLSTDNSGTCSDACFKGPIIEDRTLVPLWM
jgi:hypothetical protein